MCGAYFGLSYNCFQYALEAACFLEEAVQGSMLSGLIEAEETYLLESQKGVCVTGVNPEKMVNLQQNAVFLMNKCAFVLPRTDMVMLWRGV